MLIRIYSVKAKCLSSRSNNCVRQPPANRKNGTGITADYEKNSLTAVLISIFRDISNWFGGGVPLCYSCIAGHLPQPCGVPCVIFCVG